MTKIEKMIKLFQDAESLLLESRTEIINYSDKQRNKFCKQGWKLKAKGIKLYWYLIDKIGIDEEYLNELLKNDGV